MYLIKKEKKRKSASALWILAWGILQVVSAFYF